MKYGIRLLFCVGLCALLSVPAYAAEYVLSPEDVLEGEVLDPDDGVVASGSDAIMLLSSYGSPYDGTIGTTYTTYFRGVVEKLPPSMCCSVRINTVTVWFTVMIWFIRAVVLRLLMHHM